MTKAISPTCGLAAIIQFDSLSTPIHEMVQRSEDDQAFMEARLFHSLVVHELSVRDGR
jgi:hypothetical protein